MLRAREASRPSCGVDEVEVRVATLAPVVEEVRREVLTFALTLLRGRGRVGYVEPSPWDPHPLPLPLLSPLPPPSLSLFLSVRLYFSVCLCLLFLLPLSICSPSLSLSSLFVCPSLCVLSLSV